MCKNKDKAAHNAAKRKLEELRQQAEHAAQQVRDAEALCVLMEQCSTDIEKQERPHLLLLSQQYNLHQSTMSPSQLQRAPRPPSPSSSRLWSRIPVRLHAAARAEVVAACENLAHCETIDIADVFAVEPLMQKEAGTARRTEIHPRPRPPPSPSPACARHCPPARKLNQQLDKLQQLKDADALEKLLEGIDWPAELAVPEALNKAHSRLDQLRHQDRQGARRRGAPPGTPRARAAAERRG